MACRTLLRLSESDHFAAGIARCNASVGQTFDEMLITTSRRCICMSRVGGSLMYQGGKLLRRGTRHRALRANSMRTVTHLLLKAAIPPATDDVDADSLIPDINVSVTPCRSPRATHLLARHVCQDRFLSYFNKERDYSISACSSSQRTFRDALVSN